MKHWGQHEHFALYSLALPSFDAELELGALQETNDDYFLCLLAGDFSQASAGQIVRLAQGLVEAGACYFVCWGPGCERAHDLIDDVTLMVTPPEPDHSIIPSTWHADELLTEALFFLLRMAWPDPAYQASCNSILAISIGNSDIDNTIIEALSKPEHFLAKFQPQTVITIEWV